MYITKHIEIPEWWGWKNSDSCLIAYFNTNGNGINRNVGVAIFPLHFWRHLGFSRFNRRTFVGFGLFSFFWDSEK